MLRRLVATALLLSCLGWAGCRRLESRRLDAVRAIRSQVPTRFRPPEDGLLRNAQLDLYLKVRRAAGGGSDSDAARALGADPAALVWVRARIVEALTALDSRQVSATASDTYARVIAAVRAARAAARDAQTAARLDAEIAGLERERAAFRRADGLTPAMVRNATLVAARRSEIESAGP